jgi:hypothetical protein
MQFGVLAYLKYVQTASATKRIATIQSDESLIPVFLAMDRILSLLASLCEWTGLLAKTGVYTKYTARPANDLVEPEETRHGPRQPLTAATIFLPDGRTPRNAVAPPLMTVLPSTRTLNSP